jgi:hypothetical protein
MSYLRYLCLLAHSGAQHILCCVVFLLLLLWLSSSCVHNVARFSALSIIDCPICFFNAYVIRIKSLKMQVFYFSEYYYFF